MTTNQRLAHSMQNHMATSADSGVGRLTRSHLFYALLDSGHGDASRKAGLNFEDMCWKFITLCDRAREAKLFAHQREHAAFLRATGGINGKGL